MYKLWFIGIFSYLYITSSPLSWAENIGLTDKEIIERLVRLEEGQTSLNKRFEEGFASLNKRIDDSSKRLEEGLAGLNKRIDDSNKKLDDGFVRLDRRIDEANASINARIDDLNKRLGDINGFLSLIVSVTFLGIFSLVGFILWDRRSTVSPLITSLREQEEVVTELKRKEKSLEEALTEYSKDNPHLASLLKKKGIL